MSTGSINIPIKASLEAGRDFYRLSELAGNFGCTESLLLQYATRGHLQLSILTSPTMYVEEWGGYFDDGEIEIPQGDQPAGNRILPILAAEAYKFLTGGTTEVVSSRTADSYYKIAGTGKEGKSKLITHNDLVVTVADAEKFIGTFNQQVEPSPNPDTLTDAISTAPATPESIQLEKPMSTIERNKLLALIHGITQDIYKVSICNVSGIAEEICEDIKSHVSSMDKDAVESCLKQALNKGGKFTPVDNEKELFLKIILGLAVAYYKYKPGASKNSATGSGPESIYSRLNSIDIQIDPDTIRRHLISAMQYYLPQTE